MAMAAPRQVWQLGTTARRLRLSTTRVRRLHEQGVLRAVAVSELGALLYDPAVVEAFAAQRERELEAEPRRGRAARRQPVAV